jgi:hypothetical protein
MILVLVVALASCKKTPEVNLKYVDVERDLITVGTTTATVQCDYQYIATLKKAYLYYGEGEDEADMNTAEMRVVQNTLYVDLAGLKENTTYSYYYEFHNGFNSMRTVAKTFKTEGSGATITLPTVITAEVTEITTNSAKGGGEVTNDGGAEVTECGICWSTNANPTISDSHVSAGTGTGLFSATMSGLQASTTYHVRAYATNEKGTAYGLDREFVTIGGGSSGVSEGAIDGLFSVSSTQKVYFSQGNLQYQASTNTWRFAENQWNLVGGQFYAGEIGNVYENGVKCDNMLVSATYSGWIDLFCWGTSGWDCGNVYYHPYDKDGEGEQYGPLGYSSLTEEYANSDWGVYNSIINGGNQPGLWRTMTLSEWYYVLNYRDHASEKFSMAQVNGVHGCVILPDDWTCPSGLSFVPQSFDWITNVYTEEQWIRMELNGAVFLPASGERNSIGLLNYDRCEYHTANASSDWACWHFIIDIGGFVGDTGYTRVLAPAVRLVQNANSSTVKPFVETSDVTSITSNSAICGGEVTSDGGAIVTERGICWSTNANPTISDSHVFAGTGTGLFSATMSGLQASTTYHVRAYATNSAGTAYGLDKEFTTLSGGGGGGGNAPIGAIDGLFTINANGDQVYFSQGNLQYQASTNTWRFAENQWSFVGGFYEYLGITSGNVSGSSNNDISSTYEGWIDLFGWGTSGYNHGATCYQPWSIGYSNYYFYAYGSSNYNLYDQTGQADWGYNAISNGGNIENLWRSLSVEEWVYVIDSRNTSSNIRYSKAIVNDVKGLILLPDNWNPETFSLNGTNSPNAFYDSNTISTSEWTMLENAGAVFLPSADYRITSSYMGINNTGAYWTASSKDDSHSYHLSVWEGSVQADNYVIRANGLSVRLVQDANP